MIKNLVKRTAYAGSSALCGIASYVCLSLGFEYKAPVPFFASAGFALASAHMAEKAIRDKGTEDES